MNVQDMVAKLATYAAASLAQHCIRYRHDFVKRWTGDISQDSARERFSFQIEQGQNFLEYLQDNPNLESLEQRIEAVDLDVLQGDGFDGVIAFLLHSAYAVQKMSTETNQEVSELLGYRIMPISVTGAAFEGDDFIIHFIVDYDNKFDYPAFAAANARGQMEMLAEHQVCVLHGRYSSYDYNEWYFEEAALIIPNVIEVLDLTIEVVE